MDSSDIGAVLAHYGWDGAVSGYGDWNNTRCPFHDDRHQSARVNLEAGAFACLAAHCGIQGDVYKVIEMHEGVSFLEAKERVKGITGHELVPLMAIAGALAVLYAARRL